MKKLQKQVFQGSLAGFMMIFVSFYVEAEETIIQQEKISFEKCLKVITTSQDKLSVAPEITDVSDQKRIAFLLLLTVRSHTCDGIKATLRFQPIRIN